MTVHLLSPDPQQRGRLLESVTAALLRSQGYQEIRAREIHGGEEIDVVASASLPIPGGVVRMPVMCECKALRSAVDMPAWNIFKGKLYSARSVDARTIGILISLRGVTANVRENFDMLKKTPEGGSIYVLDEEGILGSLFGLGFVCDPSTVQQRIEALCPNRLAGLAIGILPSRSGLFKCFWIQSLFDDNGTEAYATVLQGDCSPVGPKVLETIRDCGAVGKDVEIIPTEGLQAARVAELESDRKNLRKLIGRGNSQYVHLLPERASISVISEMIVSFANSNDGKLIFGASAGIVKGITHPDTIRQHVLSASSFPHCRPDVRVAEPTAIELDGFSLLVFNIQKQNLRRCTGDGRCLLRQNGTVTPNFALFEESSFESQPLPVRFGPVPSHLELLDQERVASFQRNILQHKPGLANLNERDLLVRFGCIVEVDEGFVPSIAGLLIFGKDPGKYFPSYGIRAVRFRGTDIAEGSELYVDRLELDEPIPVAIDSLMGFIMRNIRAGAELIDVDRQDVFEYPRLALREAVVNCLVHLDYSLRHKASVYIFDDRIEFSTPGGLPRGANIEKMRSNLPQHWPRNLRICEVMQYVEKSFENLGSGIGRMTKAMGDAGLPAPKFMDDGMEFKVTMLGRAGGSSGASRPTLPYIRPAPSDQPIVGNSTAIKGVIRAVERVAPTDSTVLIRGETGTGKELVARAIYRRSQRASNAFVSLNCAVIPRDLIASELFGHEKGAFTGATQRRLGRFELAERGTIFLDEVGELPADTQVALLRVLQEREFERVGGTEPVRSNVRVIAASNRDLEAAIAAGTFRSDLFYRLNVFPIEMPSLRERREDIPLLVEYFLDRYARQAGKSFQAVDSKSLDLLQSYPWPGNIRELQNMIERSVIVSETGTLSVDQRWLSRDRPTIEPDSGAGLFITEKAIIEAALRECGGRVGGPSGAAAKLGVPRTTLESKIRSLMINKNRFKPA
jgi:DNA-binding NtrC family response regulator/predicted HTH transcriptional regulator